MTKQRKKFFKEEKLEIIKEAGSQGVRVILEKYGVYAATFYSWKPKFAEMDETGFSHGITKEKLARIKGLKQENELLKQLLAEKEIESKLKDELLKNACRPLVGSIPK